MAIRRRRRSGMSMGKFRRLVRSAMVDPFKSRVRIFDDALTTAQSPKNYSLLACDDDPDYDLSSNGTTVAECQPLSKIVGIDLTLGIGDIDIGDSAEFILYKDPDGVLAGQAPATLFTADVSTTTALLRKYTLAYGIVGPASSNTDARTQKIRIRRKALRRAGGMREGDILRLVITNNNTTDSERVYVVGTITWGH